MRSSLIFGLMLAVCSALPSAAKADMVLSQWYFNNPNGFGPSTLNAQQFRRDFFVDAPQYSRGTGLTVDAIGSVPANAVGGRDWNINDANDYLEFSISTLPNAIANFNRINYSYWSEQGNGPDSLTWTYSLNNGAFQGFTGNTIPLLTKNSSVSATLNLAGEAALQGFVGNARFRLRTTGANGNGFFVLTNNLAINGTAVPEPTSLLLAGLAGAGGLFGARFRRRKEALQDDDAAVPCEAAE